MKKIENNNGITLITLVVTIIILIILAGVSINLLLGSNGIITKTKYAREEYKKEQIREQVEIAIANINIKKIENGEILTVEQALIELNDENIFEEIDLANNEGTTEGYKVQLGYNEKGAVIIIDIQKDNGAQIKVMLETSGYTNQHILATIEVKTNKDEVTKLEVPKEIEKREDGKYEISRNGTYVIRAVLSSGIVLEKELKIATIDKNPPKDFTITAENQEEGLKILGTTTDTEETETSVCSSIKKYEYYIKKTTETNYEMYNKDLIEGLEEGKYNIYAIAYDMAGNSTTTETIEFQVKPITKFDKIFATGASSMAIDKSGNLWGWGYNNDGQLGEYNQYDKTNQYGQHYLSKPRKINMKDILECNIGDRCSFKIDKNGDIWSTGHNQHLQLGTSAVNYQVVPTKVDKNSNVKFKYISAGDEHVLALDENNNLWVWGRNSSGQLGDETIDYNRTKIS